MNDLVLPSPPPKLILTDDQQAAFDLMRRFAEQPWEKTFCLHGLAGTGKSTVLSQFALHFPQMLWLCTLTGKAASVLRHKTGLPATTIHSVLYELEKKASSLFSVGRNVHPLLHQTAPPTWVFLCSADRGVSLSRPDVPKASRAAAVKLGRRPPAQPARSGLDGGEHGASLEPAGHTAEQ